MKRRVKKALIIVENNFIPVDRRVWYEARGLKNPTGLRFYNFHQFFRKGSVKPATEYT